ncbi:putative cytochrome P450 [Mycobacterium xenopi 4042]|uniref:Putative cytochrome P450 n=1 Tax=Mycobacterium xenopi 4042 TaxID=1299334 RepID=X7ZU20_MYCXE|nr:putative cytochrome P450 [Mycobacterium xenopi 4042]
MFWHEPTEHTPDGEGFWSVATYAETLAVLRDPATFSSVTGGERPYGGTVLQDLPIAGQVLNMMDDPRHTDIRRLVSSGLTPRMIRRVEDDLRGARAGCSTVLPGVAFDFVVDIAAELPMQMICILLGVPEADRHWLFEAVEPGFDFGASRTASMPRLNVEDAGSQLYAYGQELIARKRAQPADDMLSTVVTATIDDPAAPCLSDAELYLFFHLLFSAGAETTRNAIAGGLLALAERPSSGAACAATASCWRRRSKRWCGGRRRRRRSGAPPPGQSPWAASRSTPVRKSWCGKARPTATPRYSTNPTNLISLENPIRT